MSVIDDFENEPHMSYDVDTLHEEYRKRVFTPKALELMNAVLQPSSPSQELKIPEDLKPMYEYCKNYHRVPIGTKAEWWNTMELIERIARLEGRQ